MDVLADDVGRRLDLEVVELEVLGRSVGVAEFGAVARLGAEEEGLGLSAPAALEPLGLAGEDVDPRLRIVPAGAVDNEIELDGGDVVADLAHRAVAAIARIGAAGIGEGGAGSRWRAVDEEPLAPALGGDAPIAAPGRRGDRLAVDQANPAGLACVERIVARSIGSPALSKSVISAVSRWPEKSPVRSAYCTACSGVSPATSAALSPERPRVPWPVNTCRGSPPSAQVAPPSSVAQSIGGWGARWPAVAGM